MHIEELVVQARIYVIEFLAAECRHRSHYSRSSPLGPSPASSYGYGGCGTARGGRRRGDGGGGRGGDVHGGRAGRAVGHADGLRGVGQDQDLPPRRQHHVHVLAGAARRGGGHQGGLRRLLQRQQHFRPPHRQRRRAAHRRRHPILPLRPHGTLRQRHEDPRRRRRRSLVRAGPRRRTGVVVRRGADVGQQGCRWRRHQSRRRVAAAAAARRRQLALPRARPLYCVRVLLLLVYLASFVSAAYVCSMYTLLFSRMLVSFIFSQQAGQQRINALARLPENNPTR